MRISACAVVFLVAAVESVEVGRRASGFMCTSGGFTLSSASNRAGNDESHMGELAHVTEELGESNVKDLGAGDVSQASAHSQWGRRRRGGFRRRRRSYNFRRRRSSFNFRRRRSSNNFRRRRSMPRPPAPVAKKPSKASAPRPVAKKKPTPSPPPPKSVQPVTTTKASPAASGTFSSKPGGSNPAMCKQSGGGLDCSLFKPHNGKPRLPPLSRQEQNTIANCPDTMSAAGFLNVLPSGRGWCYSFGQGDVLAGLSETCGRPGKPCAGGKLGYDTIGTRGRIFKIHKAGNRAGGIALKRVVCKGDNCKVFKTARCILCKDWTFSNNLANQISRSELGTFYKNCVTKAFVNGKFNPEYDCANFCKGKPSGCINYAQARFLDELRLT